MESAPTQFNPPQNKNKQLIQKKIKGIKSPAVNLIVTYIKSAPTDDALEKIYATNY